MTLKKSEVSKMIKDAVSKQSVAFEKKIDKLHKRIVKDDIKSDKKIVSTVKRTRKSPSA